MIEGLTEDKGGTFMDERKRPYDKTMGIQLAFPVHYGEEEIKRMREEAARKLAEALKEEILSTPGFPDRFETRDGFPHEPGMYRLDVDFRIRTRLERF